MVEVKIADNSFGVYAKKNFRQDEIIFKIKEKIILDHPTQFSIQIGINRHIELNHSINLFNHPEFYWRYLNHSCKPNCFCKIEDMTFRAKKNINPGEHLTFNYLTTEYDMAVPFKCNCHSESCMKWIKGFKYLNDEQKIKLLSTVTTHIRFLFEKEKILSHNVH
jgi:hypothetical protein